jgi:hypothetical protein
MIYSICNTQVVVKKSTREASNDDCVESDDVHMVEGHTEYNQIMSLSGTTQMHNSLERGWALMMACVKPGLLHKRLGTGAAVIGQVVLCARSVQEFKSQVSVHDTCCIDWVDSSTYGFSLLTVMNSGAGDLPHMVQLLAYNYLSSLVVMPKKTPLTPWKTTLLEVFCLKPVHYY